MTGRFVTKVDAVKKKLTGMFASLVPGRDHSAGPGSDESGSATVSPLTLGTIPGDDGVYPADNASVPLPEGDVAGRAFSGPVPGEASLPGNGAGNALSAARADQSGIAPVGTPQQGDSNSTVLRYTLVGLILGGLALIFFIVIMPKTKKRREQ